MKTKVLPISFLRRTLIAHAGSASLFAMPFFSTALLMPAFTHAQTAGTASIQGAVKDPSGAGIPNATILFISSETGVRREVKSAASGDFSLPNVPVGEYTLSVTAPGFSGSNRMASLKLATTHRRRVSLRR